MQVVHVTPGWRKPQAIVILGELLKKTNTAGHYRYEVLQKSLWR